MAISRYWFGVIAAGFVSLGACAARGAVTFGQLDDFGNGTLMGWAEGDPSPNPPELIPSGGPRGDGDAFLSDAASGQFGPGGRQVVFNEAQWAGDYNAAGVTRVDVSLANFGPTDVHVRLALRSTTGTTFASTTAADLPAGSGWRRVSFDLTSAALTNAGGTQSLSDALSAVRTFRLLSSGAPDWNGDIENSTLAVDDIRALRLPGDADFDGNVDAADQLLVRNHLGDSGAGVDWRAGDFNFDGRVDARDLVLLRRNLGQSVAAAGASAAAAPAVSVVPDPAGGATFLLAAVGLLARRRTRRG